MSEERSEPAEEAESSARDSGESDERPKATGFGTEEGGESPPPGPERSPRQVRSAARILHKEARRILKKHAARIAAEPAAQMRECVETIETLRDTEDVRGLEKAAEQLDELLDTHAGFARKSALRETLENIGIAVLIALGLRSCLYEPFKIPSGSMMPTLRTGDHIFVNKFVYGVQIPFTTTVVGQSLGEIERGDVIVFRYPVDETQDFIKRVVGLPGDEIRVIGRQVAIKRAGDAEFEVLPRRRLEDKCFDSDGRKPIANCTLYEETMGDKTYVVRYTLKPEERDDIQPQIWTIPEGHLMVMGDNRNDSLDSRRWWVPAEAVKADGLLTTKDLRDLTDERLFSMSRDDTTDQRDFSHDRVVFRASHRALSHDVSLEVWREPSLGADAIEATKVARLAGAKAMSWTNLVGAGEGGPLDALRRHGEQIQSLHVAQDPDGRQAIVRLSEPDAVLAVGCGLKVCPDEASLAAHVGEILDRFAENRGREARELLTRPSGGANYSSQFKSRHNPRDHYFERRFASAEVEGQRGQVRLRAFRKPDDGTEVVRDAALRSVGVEPGPDAPEPEMDDKGLRSWLIDDGEAWVGVGADTTREMVVVVECGKGVCTSEAKAREVFGGVYERVPRAAGDRRRLQHLLGVADVDGLPEVPTDRPELAEYDRVRLDATVKGDEHQVEVEAWLDPEGGVGAKVEALAAERGLSPDDALMPGAYGAADDDAVSFVFRVDESKAVVSLRCYRGICPSRETAVGLARRAANRAGDPDNFIDPEAERKVPFVPRGNVKGRAERIWLPLSRFWLPIR